MKYSLAYSPCPNDTYITGALAENRIALQNSYSIHLADVQELNQSALQGEFDITKLSFHAFAYCANQYDILPIGSALGFGNGPLVISKRKIYPDEIPFVKIAAPGKLTTATLLAGIFFGKKLNLNHYLFSDIEEVVLSYECDAGLIIHETRFTFESKGLQKVCDLGEMWEKQYHLPLPLGCFIIRKGLDAIKKESVIKDMSHSLKYADENSDSLKKYILEHSQIREWEIAKKHIDTYVNSFTKNLNDVARNSIDKMYSLAVNQNIIPNFDYKIL